MRHIYRNRAHSKTANLSRRRLRSSLHVSLHTSLHTNHAIIQTGGARMTKLEKIVLNLVERPVEED